MKHKDWNADGSSFLFPIMLTYAGQNMGYHEIRMTLGYNHNAP